MPVVFEDFRPQGEEISLLRKQLKENRLGHATLITGMEGTGKRTLARLIAEALLCTGEGERPCGECKGCRMAFAGEHPDLIVLRRGTPLSQEVRAGRTTIPVDDIREVIRILSAHSFEGGKRVVIVENAEHMTPQAQNSLLKTLEEPPEETFFLLTSAHPEALLSTIISRCRRLKLKPWEMAYIRNVLEDQGISADRAMESARDADGSIGRALALAGDEAYWKMRAGVMEAFFHTTRRSEILRISGEWKDRKDQAEALFTILENCVNSLMRFRVTGEGNLAGFPEGWTRMAREGEKDAFPRLFDAITQARRQLQANVNFQALFEQLLIVFTGEGVKW